MADISLLLVLLVSCLIHYGRGATEVKLEGSNDVSQGRVMVRDTVVWGNEWGTVCDDEFTSGTAVIVCKMLGYTKGVVVNATELYGPANPSTPIHVREINCDGGADTLAQCSVGQSTGVSCKHYEDVGVQCSGKTGVTDAPQPTTTKTPIIVLPDKCDPNDQKDKIIRLRGPREGMGIVEVKQGGEWGTVCDDYMGTLNAIVICRMLCFNELVAMAGTPASGLTPNDTVLDIKLDNVQCDGSEPSIFECDHDTWGSSNCLKTDWASVTCKPYQTQDAQAPIPTLMCSSNKLQASFSKDLDPHLQDRHLSVKDQKNKTLCDPEIVTKDPHVTIIVPYDSCGTQSSFNETHITYSNTILYDYTSTDGLIYRVNTYEVRIKCVIPKQKNINNDVKPMSMVVTQKSIGEFAVDMTFYSDKLFQNELTGNPIQLTLGKFIFVKIALKDADPNLKLVVPSCYATPSKEANDPTKHQLIQHNCNIDTTVGQFPFTKHELGWNVKTFKFVNNPTFYIHCQTYVCLGKETTRECDRSCTQTSRKRRATAYQEEASLRRKRHASEGSVEVHGGPFYIIERDYSQTVIIQREVEGEGVKEIHVQATEAPRLEATTHTLHEKPPVNAPSTHNPMQRPADKDSNSNFGDQIENVLEGIKNDVEGDVDKIIDELAASGTRAVLTKTLCFVLFAVAVALLDSDIL